MMAWDNIQILQAIDRLQQQNDGRVLWQSGYDLMNQIAGVYVVVEQRMPGFLQELRIASEAGLLTFRVSDHSHPSVRPQNACLYLQHIRDIALTVEGQDRARGQVVVQPVPDPAEDDGRQLSDLILNQIAAAITEEYAPDEVAVFYASRASRRKSCYCRTAWPRGTPTRS